MGFASALAEAPPLCTSYMGSALFVESDSGGIETLAETLVRSRNSIAWPKV